MTPDKRKRSLLATAFVALAATAAAFLLSTQFQRSKALFEHAIPDGGKSPASNTHGITSLPLKPLLVKQLGKFIPPKGAIPNEMLLRFANTASMQAFLKQAAKAGARVLGIIPGLNAVRIGFDDAAQGDELLALAPDSASIGVNYIATTPTPPDPSKAEFGGPYLGFGNRALGWLGVPDDHETWGAGVKVALLDTGVDAVPGLSQKSISMLDLISQSGGAAGDQQHGTAMASIIAGNSPDAPGIAPSAQLLSIRVLDANESGDSFTIAQGIMDAVDSGARVISMSLGSYGDSSIMRDAISYALAHDVAIVAAVGNDGTGSVSYPAKYPGVVAVTAVDANGQRAQFANYGAEVSISAPGIGVYTPWNSDTVLNVSGTSAAVPFVSGALAAVLSQNAGMSAQTAAGLLIQYANDTGAPGPDPMFGAGILSLDRVENRNQPGINDAALAGVYYGQVAGQGNAPVLAVTVQNRGTTALLNVELNVQVNQQPQSFNFNALGVGEVRSGFIPLDPAQLQTPDGVVVGSRVTIDGVQDAKPANDAKAVVLKTKTAGGQ